MKRSRDSSSEEEEDEEPEEYGNSDIEDEEEEDSEGGGLEGESDYDDEDDQSEDNKKDVDSISIDPNVPMYKLLQQARAASQLQKSSAASVESSSSAHHTKRIKHEKRKTVTRDEKRSKSAPAEMRSDKPVRRLRIDADNSKRKFLDPRFADYTGSLDQKIYAKNYSFLDSMRASEIERMSKTYKKTKNTDTKEKIKQELFVMKQQLNERKLALKAMERIDTMKQEEKQKIKEGKNPYYMKNSVKKNIMAEERFSALKKQGRLQKYMNKKRKKNVSKDRSKIPERRFEE